jgi:hypothetical protein
MFLWGGRRDSDGNFYRQFACSVTFALPIVYKRLLTLVVPVSRLARHTRLRYAPRNHG